MKNRLAVFAVLCLTVTANATSLRSDGEAGFYENGFQSPKEICYVGSAKDVCGIVEKVAAEVVEAYSSGDHGYFEIQSCTVNENEVNLTYQRITDYDGTSGVQPLSTYVVAACK